MTAFCFTPPIAATPLTQKPKAEPYDAPRSVLAMLWAVVSTKHQWMVQAGPSRGLQKLWGDLLYVLGQWEEKTQPIGFLKKNTPEID